MVVYLQPFYQHLTIYHLFSLCTLADFHYLCTRKHQEQSLLVSGLTNRAWTLATVVGTMRKIYINFKN